MFLKPGGYAQVSGNDVGTVKTSHGGRIHFRGDFGEMDTFTCFHCDSVVHVPAKCDPAEMGGLCKICMKLICKDCLNKGCTPFEEQLKIWMARTAALASYGL